MKKPLSFVQKLNEEAKNIFGFRAPQIKPPEGDVSNDASPIQQFAIEKMLRALSQNNVQGGKGKFRFTNDVTWGTGTGAIRVKVTPNMGVIIERQTDDRDGGVFWVCRRVYRIKVQEYAGHEETVAGEIIGEVEEIAREPIDAAQPEYKLESLVNKLVDRVKNYTSGPFIYSLTRKHNNDWYTLLFNMRGMGVGQLVRQAKGGSTPAGIIELIFYPTEGRVHCIVTTIGIEEESDSWIIMVPYFLADFAPSQDIEEVANNIFTGLRTI